MPPDQNNPRTSALAAAPLVAIAALAVAACSASTSGADATATPAPSDQSTATGAEVSSIQAVGDSILEWHADVDESIPDVVGEALGVRVENNSVGGSTLLGNEPIVTQLRSGTASHVLVTGGGNDLAERCDAATSDALMSPDLATGAMVELIDSINAGGAHAVLVGYYAPIPGSEFDCPQIAATMARYRQFAEKHAGASFVDTTAVVSPAQPGLYDDEVHPSITGARVVGTAIAQALS